MKPSRRFTRGPIRGGGRTSICISSPGDKTYAGRSLLAAPAAPSAICARASASRGFQRRQSIFRLRPPPPNPVRDRDRQAVTARNGQHERQQQRAEEQDADLPVRDSEAE